MLDKWAICPLPSSSPTDDVWEHEKAPYGMVHVSGMCFYLLICHSFLWFPILGLLLWFPCLSLNFFCPICSPTVNCWGMVCPKLLISPFLWALLLFTNFITVVPWVLIRDLPKRHLQPYLIVLPCSPFSIIFPEPSAMEKVLPLQAASLKPSNIHTSVEI